MTFGNLNEICLVITLKTNVKTGNTTRAIAGRHSLLSAALTVIVHTETDVMHYVKFTSIISL